MVTEINEQELFQAIVRGGQASTPKGYVTTDVVRGWEDSDGSYHQEIVRKYNPWDTLPNICEVEILKKGSRIRVLCRPNRTGNVLQSWENPFECWYIRTELQALFPEAKNISFNVRRGGCGSQGMYLDTANIYIDLD